MDDESGLSKHRVETLTDGIFAVAMTLLVLNINVPEISSHSTSIIETELAKRLFDLWPKVLSYGISFVILAIYWSAHRRQFHYVKHTDGVLIWTNIMFLMAISLLPFSTSLIGQYREQQLSIFVYGGNSIIIAFLLYIQWMYVTNHYRLVDKNLDPYIKKMLPTRLLFGILIYLIAIGVSFLYIHLSIFLFTLMVIPGFFPNKMIHRKS